MNRINDYLRALAACEKPDSSWSTLEELQAICPSLPGLATFQSTVPCIYYGIDYEAHPRKLCITPEGREYLVQHAHQFRMDIINIVAAVAAVLAFLLALIRR